MTTEDTGKRLSVSEESLKLHLSELELRLRIFLTQELAAKADANIVLELARQLAALERGDITPAFKRALIQVIEEETVVSKSTVWTRRERAIMVIGIAITCLVFALNVYVVIHATQRPSVPTGTVDK